jgi:nucleoside-diphosphate-sugar epimerase
MSTPKETIIITGSSGLIGYAVTKRLDTEFEAVGFDRAGPPYPPPNAECVSVDMTSKDSLQHGLQGVREHHGEHLAAVIHLAAYYDFSGKPSPKYDYASSLGGWLAWGWRVYSAQQPCS